MKKLLTTLIVVCTLTTLFIGCSPTSPVESPTLNTIPTNEIGTLEVRVGDAPPSASVDHIWVTISNLETHQQGGTWIPIDDNPPMFDLKLIQGTDQVLTSQTMVVGQYTQIRFQVMSVAIQVGPQTYNATLPDDLIKLVETFDIVSSKTTMVTIDFDASRSIEVNSKGEYAYKPVIRLMVPKPGVLGIATPSLENGEVGLEYQAGLRPELQAIGGKKPYTWSVSSGTLPPGLSLNPVNGIISGKPTEAGTYNLTIQVKDASVSPQVDIKSFVIRIASINAFLIVTTSLPNGEQGEPYTANIDAIFGTTPYMWRISAGILPDGLSIDPISGDISGIATKRGDYSFSITVTDSASPQLTDTQVLSLYIQ